jgi:hypothetical protein
MKILKCIKNEVIGSINLELSKDNLWLIWMSKEWGILLLQLRYKISMKLLFDLLREGSIMIFG